MKYEEMSTKELKQKLALYKAIFRYERDYYSAKAMEEIEKILKERRKILKK